MPMGPSQSGVDKPNNVLPWPQFADGREGSVAVAGHPSPTPQYGDLGAEERI